MAQRKKRLLNLEEISRFDNLLVFAQAVVEGYFSGRHKANRFGWSSEFAEHREYLPGDELQHIDWRVYGKTRRLHTRKYEDDTDMVLYLVVDASASMDYARPGAEVKDTQAGRIAAALAYLMTRQGDKVSLTLFNDRVRTHLPPGGTRKHLHNAITQLESAVPRAGTDIPRALRECCGMFRKRGRIVLLSDFLGDPRELFDALSQFTHRGFDILLLQVLDQDELDLPEVDNARFVDMETAAEVQVEPAEIRRAYRAMMAELVDTLAMQANRRRIRYRRVSTERSYIEAIEAYLGFRSADGLGA